MRFCRDNGGVNVEPCQHVEDLMMRRIADHWFGQLTLASVCFTVVVLCAGEDTRGANPAEGTISETVDAREPQLEAAS